MSGEGETSDYLPARVLAAVEALANADGWDGQHAVIVAHPVELLGEDADLALRVLISRYADRPEVAVPLEDLRGLLADCREHGVAEAFAQRIRLGRDGVRPEVLGLLHELPDDAVVILVTRSPALAQPFLQAIVDLVEAATASAKRAVLQRESDLLLHPAAEVLVRALPDLPSGSQHADLLAQARARGINRAVRHHFGRLRRVYAGMPTEVDEILQELAYGRRYLSIDRKLELTRRGLRLVEPATPPWASLLTLLSDALMDSYGADRAERLEEAIAGYSALAAWAEEQGLAKAAAHGHLGLSHAYFERIQGDRQENLVRAVAEAERAIELAAAGDGNPEDYAQPRYYAAMALKSSSGGPESLVLAHRYATEALAVTQDPESAAGLRQALALIAGKGGPDEHGDGGLTLLRQAVDGLSPSESPDNWSQIQLDLGRQLIMSGTGGVEEAIAVLESALAYAHPERQAERWASIKTALASAYLTRTSGDLSDNLERALHHIEQALTIYTQDKYPERWSEGLGVYARALRRRLHGNPVINVQEAIDTYQTLAEHYTEVGDRAQWADTQMNLGLALLTGSDVGIGQPEDGWAAIQLALTEYERLGDTANVAHAHLGLLSSGIRLLRGREAEGVFASQVMSHAEHVHAYYTQEREPDDYVTAELALGQLDHVLAKDDPIRLLSAIRHFETAIASSTPHAAMDVFNVREELAVIRFQLGDSDGALSVLAEAISDGERLLDAAITEQTQQPLLATLSAVYTHAAYLELRRGEFTTALRLLEQGRSRLLLDTFAPDLDFRPLDPLARARIERARARVEAARNALNSEFYEESARLGRALEVARGELATSLADSGGPASEPDLWRVTAHRETIVLPVVTRSGSALFVIPPGVRELTGQHVVMLEAEHSDLLGARVAWLTGMARFTTAQASLREWTNQVDEVTTQLWFMAAGSLRMKLVELGVPDGAALCIVASSLSGQLPLHAAWREADGRRRALLDDYVISYTPGLRMLEQARRRAAEPGRRGGTALLAGDAAGDLPHAADEVRSIAALFPDEGTRILLGTDVTSAALFTEAANHQYVHLACHAFSNWLQPLYSSLLLAGGETVTAAQLAALDMSAARLVVLSACESGIEVREASGDITALAASFLRAGAPAVIAALWNIDDYASGLLMRRFYGEMLEGNAAPAEALRRAQLWLRDATVACLLTFDEAPEAARRWRLLNAAPDQRPYANPYFWAGYLLIGALGSRKSIRTPAGISYREAPNIRRSPMHSKSYLP
jgi:tetratricopeptide (TPR) repeat protein